MKRTCVALAMVTMLATSTPTLGDVIVNDGRPADIPHREVRFGDLNLDTQQGMDTLNRRIHTAIRIVCGDGSRLDLTKFMIMRNCQNESQARAFAARDAMLAARLAARGQPGRLAAVETSLSVATAKAR